MRYTKVSLKEAIKFHGHLGPYLVLGILAGELALKKLNYKKYFGLDVNVWGANKKPKSCLIDGLQLSTGATYGKGNIRSYNGRIIKIEFNGSAGRKRFSLGLKNDLVKRLASLKTHAGSEAFAKKLYNTNYLELFKVNRATS
jgi:formylmethanofuran dehydrogenase subunit E